MSQPSALSKKLDQLYVSIAEFKKDKEAVKYCKQLSREVGSDLRHLLPRPLFRRIKKTAEREGISPFEKVLRLLRKI